jgi:hypothetical protein
MQHHPEPLTPDTDDVRKKADAFARQVYADVWQQVQKSYSRSTEDEADEATEQAQE